jgi:CubicO group peptidase (beta-lactamase class C family)
MRGTVFAAAGLGVLLLPALGRAEEAKRAKAAYFPPPESKGGWRSLLPAKGEPSAAQKAAIAKTAGVDWDRLKEAWDVNAEADGASGLLVIRHGYVVGEWYKNADKNKRFNIFSSSKPYTSLAFGLLLADSAAGKLAGGKKLALDTKVCTADWLPEALPLPDPRKADITLRHLLNMTSGVGPEAVPLFAAFEVALGKTKGSAFAKLKADPGTRFFYSNAGVAHLVLVFKNAAGQDLFPYLQERLWAPIGVEAVRWQKIGGGEELIGPYSQGFSGIFTTPREHARFCYLALHKGAWAGKRVVPAAHYDFAWTGTKANPVYGAQWWLAGNFKGTGAPKDLVATLGAFNNDGFVVPSLDLVVVRLGDSRKFPKDFKRRLVEKVLAAVKK